MCFAIVSAILCFVTAPSSAKYSTTCAREYERTTNAALIRKFGYAPVKFSNTVCTTSAALRHILENQHVRRVQCE